MASEEWDKPWEYLARTFLHPQSLLCTNVYLVLTAPCHHPLFEVFGWTLGQDADQCLFLLVTSLRHGWMNYVAETPSNTWLTLIMLQWYPSPPLNLGITSLSGSTWLLEVIKLPGHNLEQQRPCSHGTSRCMLYKGFTTTGDSGSTHLLRAGVWCPSTVFSIRLSHWWGLRVVEAPQVQQYATKCTSKLPSNRDSPARD